MPKDSRLGGNRYLLVLDDKGDRRKSKDTITWLGLNYVTYYQIPRGQGGQCFSTRERDRENGDFLAVNAQSFANCTEKDKLYICGHGDDNSCGHYSAKDVAKLLRDSGLRRVGLVTFKSCCVGRKNYLDKFVAKCGACGISLGYAKGYTDDMYAWVVQDTNKPRTDVGKDKGGAAGSNPTRSDKTNATRWKIVTGPLAKDLGWGRFATPEQVAERQKGEKEALLKKLAAQNEALERQLAANLLELEDEKYNNLFGDL